MVAMSDLHRRLGIRETFGLSPVPRRLAEAWLAVRGQPHVPPTRFGLSSLGIFMPALSLKTWLGWRPADRTVPIYNLFNRTPTPLEEGWSVKKIQVRDFRGGRLTYDSHNGTDFALPVGTVVVAAAAGKVLRISSEFNRGGLKVFIDHGRGLITTSNHLGRALVQVGDVVQRGQPVALSGYSGLDGFIAFPWSCPHVHFNVWLDGEYVDPFAEPGEASLWLHHNDPRPDEGANGADGSTFEPTRWDPDAVAAGVEACLDPSTRDELAAEPDPGRRAMNLLFQRNYYPTRFRGRPALESETHVRAPWLTLPLRREDYDGVAFPAS